MSSTAPRCQPAGSVRANSVRTAPGAISVSVRSTTIASPPLLRSSAPPLSWTVAGARGGRDAAGAAGALRPTARAPVRTVSSAVLAGLDLGATGGLSLGEGQGPPHIPAKPAIHPVDAGR